MNLWPGNLRGWVEVTTGDVLGRSASGARVLPQS